MIANSEYVNVTADGGVRLRVLKPGSNSSDQEISVRPPHHARCLVHYKGTIDEDGALFSDTRADQAEPVMMVAGRVASLAQRGLCAALCMMSRGEVAEVKCRAEYGYGEKGNFSFPSVPPNADITYEVELIDWEEPLDHEDPEKYTFFEEKVEAAERRRIQGNDLFRDGDVLAALGKYNMALSFLPEDLMFQLQGFHEDAAWDIKLPTLLNMAACHLRLLDYNAAITCCNQALEREPENAKALFRRGRAKQELGQTDAARKDLEQAQKLAPADTAIRKSLMVLRQEEKDRKKATAAAFRGKLASQSSTAAASLEHVDGSSDNMPHQDQAASKVDELQDSAVRRAPVGSLSWLTVLLQRMWNFLIRFVSTRLNSPPAKST